MKAEAAIGQRSSLWSIQYLRAVAALMVVCHHARNPHPGAYNPLSGFGSLAYGVDIFFVISGFIMYSIGRREGTGEFYSKRLLRIVPMYWLATFAQFGLDFARAGHLPFSRADVAKSLFFIPFHNDAQGGQVWPYLVPGWTLNYEMLFYAVCGAAIATKRFLLVTSVTLVCLILAGWAAPGHNAIWQTYTDPLILEFLAGMLIAWAFERLSFDRLIFLLPTGFVAIFAADLLPHLPRVICAGIPASGILIGALGFEARGRVTHIGWAKLLGDASYSVYLFHILMLFPLWLLIDRTSLAGWPQFISYVGLVLVASCVMGIVLHLWVERPLLHRLKSALQPRVIAA